MSAFARRSQFAATFGAAVIETLFPAADNAIFPDKKFWAHAIFNGLPEYSDVDDNGLNRFYGELYPLELVKGTWRTPLRSTRGIPRLLEAGITGIQILVIDSPNAFDIIHEYGNLTNSTTNNPDPLKRVQFAGCLQINIGDPVELIRGYVTAASNYASAAKINGKYVLYMYASSSEVDGFNPAKWAAIRNDNRIKNLPIYYIFDYGLDASQNGNSITAASEAKTSALFPYCDANYLFDDSLQYFWPRFVTFVNKYHRPQVGGVMPGYDRENQGENGGYRDALGTGVYRELLENFRGSGIRWQNIITWNDIVERHEVRPTSDWNKTRSDITAFYSAIHRGIPQPRPQAELYVTVPKAIKVGAKISAEAMVLNGSQQSVTTTIQLFNQAGQALGSVYTSSSIGSNQSGDATTPGNIIASTAQAGQWIRAKAQLKNQAGTVIQEVVSAPICIYPSSANPTAVFRRLYYSTPAYAALQSAATISITNSPVSSPNTSKATVTTNGGQSMRFIEVLQNTRQVWMEFDVSSYTTSSVPNGQGGYADKLPMNPRSSAGGHIVTASAQGFYVGRVIDNQERVGYSDPIYYA